MELVINTDFPVKPRKTAAKKNKLLALSLEEQSKAIIRTRYPEFGIYLSEITFPQDISSYPIFNYYKISNRVSIETLAFIASLVEPVYEEVRASILCGIRS